MNVADTPITLSLAKRRDRSMLSNALVKHSESNHSFERFRVLTTAADSTHLVM